MTRLKRAKEEDKALIYRWWKGIFAEDDGGHTDYYFDQLYKANQSYLLVDDHDELISSCQVHTRNIDFNGKTLQASFLVGIFTIPKYRGQGYMKDMLTKIIDILEHRDLLTFIQGYNPDLYVPYGFEKIYRRNHYWLDVLSLPTMSPMGVTYSCSALELRDLYRQFTKHFTGYVVRSTEDFNQLLLELNALGGKLIAYSDNGNLLAYAFVYAHSTHIEIEEMVYLNTKALMSILASLKSLNLPIRLSVSEKEDLSRIFPYATVEQSEYTNVRVNDYRILNEFFKLNVKSSEAFFMAAEKPLWFRENQ